MCGGPAHDAPVFRRCASGHSFDAHAGLRRSLETNLRPPPRQGIHFMKSKLVCRGTGTTVRQVGPVVVLVTLAAPVLLLQVSSCAGDVRPRAPRAAHRKSTEPRVGDAWPTSDAADEGNTPDDVGYGPLRDPFHPSAAFIDEHFLTASRRARAVRAWQGCGWCSPAPTAMRGRRWWSTSLAGRARWGSETSWPVRMSRRSDRATSFSDRRAARES